MKAVFRIALIMTGLVVLTAFPVLAQRVITGTVYREGKPAAGVTVEAHRGGSMMTSFDGKYKVEAHEKTKWLRFTFLDESEKLDISDETGNSFDFAFDGIFPGDTETESADVVLKSAEELIRDQDRDFMNELSLYNEYYKQGNYSSALPHWKNVYNKYPKSTLNLYIHGANMYEKMIENADSPEDKEKYINELMKLYDKRIKYFNEKGFVLGRKATAWLKYKLQNDKEQENGHLTETLKTGYDWLTESVKERGNETELPVLVLLMQTTRSLYMLEEVPKETVVRNYETCRATMKNMLENSEDEQLAQDVNKVQAYIDDIFGTSGAADCNALISIFTPQYEENKDDLEFIKSMLRRLSNAHCDESPLFAEATERLYELEPSAEAAFNMARRYLQRDDDEGAKKYYLEAIEQETDKALLAKYYYEYALLLFANEQKLQEARSYARQALDAKPDYCEAYMLIGDIYVAASSSFGEDDFEKNTVFWVAVDYYERARSYPDCAVQASQKASTYRNYFPNKEEAFFRSMQEGQTYKVGGWINENTKVRF